MKRPATIAVFALVALAVRAAAAEPIVVRMASVAPEGSAWAKLLGDWGRELAALSGGALRARWYFSGVTGDELATFDG
ncbi:MAG TPA: hypothetical protein VF997_23715, partial [Polyangia bacterium]